MVDDGTIADRRGSLTVDDEGTPSSRTVLIEDGILVGFMQDRMNARLMGAARPATAAARATPTKPMPRMTNTVMLAGAHAPEEIIRSVKRGLYAVSFGGGQVDITSGKFVFSCTEAYLIEDGAIGAPVKGATLIGNGPDALTASAWSATTCSSTPASAPAARTARACRSIKDGDAYGFANDVIKASMAIPVIVDFWAPWCGPCKTLTPLLEKLVRQAGGRVRLVKINIDENQDLAAQLRIQSVPTVYAFVGGRPIDAFVGAQPESKVRAFVDRLTRGAGSPIEEAVELANEALASGDVAAAANVFAQVLQQDPRHPKAVAGAIRAHARRRRS